MSVLVLDIETDSIVDRKISTIWLCCCEDADKDRKWSFVEPEGLQQLVDSYDTIVGHNIIGFDAPMLESKWNVKIPEDALSTLLAFPHRTMLSRPHSSVHPLPLEPRFIRPTSHGMALVMLYC